MAPSGRRIQFHSFQGLMIPSHFADALKRPQGWAVRGLMQALNAEPVSSVLITALVLLAWSIVFFIIGVWRFNKRYA